MAEPPSTNTHIVKGPASSNQQPSASANHVPPQVIAPQASHVQHTETPAQESTHQRPSNDADHIPDWLQAADPNAEPESEPIFTEEYKAWLRSKYTDSYNVYQSCVVTEPGQPNFQTCPRETLEGGKQGGQKHAEGSEMELKENGHVAQQVGGEERAGRSGRDEYFRLVLKAYVEGSSLAREDK